MKKNMKIIASVLLMVVVIFAPIFNNSQLTDSNKMITEWEKLNNSLHDTTWEIDEYTRLSIEMNKRIEKIPYDINNDAEKMNWFIEYKNIVNQYPKELHNRSIYDAYAPQEIELFFSIVQSETGDEYGFIEKANVASVVFNRHYNNGSLTQVLTEKGQFSPYETGKYKTVTIDEKTILACEFVYMFGDTTNGCIAFRSHNSCPDVWHNWTRQFEDKAHCFYK